jgi:hypothetical protein
MQGNSHEQSSESIERIALGFHCSLRAHGRRLLCGWPEATAAEDLTRGHIAENYPSNYGKLAGGAARPSASKTPSRNRPGSRSSSLAS